MEKRETLRFINPKPVLALILAKREPRVIPKELDDWAIRWIADIGMIMRSREYMAYTAALYGGMGLMSAFLGLIPDVALLDTFLKRLGFAE